MRLQFRVSSIASFCNFFHHFYFTEINYNTSELLIIFLLQDNIEYRDFALILTERCIKCAWRIINAYNSVSATSVCPFLVVLSAIINDRIKSKFEN